MLKLSLCGPFPPSYSAGVLFHSTRGQQALAIPTPCVYNLIPGSQKRVHASLFPSEFLKYEKFPPPSCRDEEGVGRRRFFLSSPAVAFLAVGKN